MKEYLRKIQDGNCSTAELVLLGTCLFLAGVIIGMKCAPARFGAYGSFNGNQGSLENPEVLEELKKCCSK